MGAGTILSGGVDGLYSVKLDRGKIWKDYAIAECDALIALLTTNLAEYPPVIAAREANIVQLTAALNNAITIYQFWLNVDPDRSETKDAAKGVNSVLASKLQAEAGLTALIAKQNSVKAQMKSAQDRKTAVQAVQAEVTQDVWCADYTLDKTGAVGTIEIPGEPSTVIMAPQSMAEGAPALLSAGNVVARELMRSDHIYLNAAVLPGWQAWKPTYRRGLIMALDTTANTATVGLFPADSSAKDKNYKPIDINHRSAVTLTNVPVTYMTCNAAAFAVDDSVVVMFDNQSWASPRVIGFIDNPKPCTVFVLALHGFYNDPLTGGVSRSFGVVVTSDGTVIDQRIQVATSVEFDGAFSRSNGYWFEFSGAGLIDGDEYLKVIRMTDGNENFLPERLFQFSRDNTELFALDLERLSQRIAVVLDDGTLAVNRTFEVWPYPSGYAYSMDAGGGKLVVGGFTGTLYAVRIYETDGTYLSEIALGASDFIFDVSIGSQYISVIFMPGFTTPWLYVYSIATGAVVDSIELGNGWESVTMYGSVIAVQGSFGTGSIAGGNLRIYKLISGDIVLQSETSPFSSLIETYGLTLGVSAAGR